MFLNEDGTVFLENMFESLVIVAISMALMLKLAVN